MKPLIYKGLRLGTNKTEWVSSDEIKQSYSQIRLLAVQNDNYAWIPIADDVIGYLPVVGVISILDKIRDLKKTDDGWE